MGIINMGESHQVFQDSWFQHDDEDHHMNNNNEKSTPSSSSTITSSIREESTLSNGSSVTSFDDDASSASSSFSPNSSRALFDLSEIMAQLPIKRGLSKFYKGKSESFTSLSRVTSIDDLAKKANQNRRRNMKAAASQSIGTGLHSYNSYTLPRATISKKPTTRGSSFSCKTHY